ncbi:MAG: HEPN domain-containing protein [Candidatus Binatia bacterium]
MPHDPALVAETRAWLRKAAEDLRAADVERSANPPVTSDMVFHAQQAAEKILKGFLVWHRQTFRKTHSLEELGEQCLKIDAGLKTIIDKAVPLTEYAWKFRYPGEPDDPSSDEAEIAVAVARELLDEVLSRLPHGVHP